ncbi:class I SAM-dependent methyltransferase [Nonomuraea soli]|uniref:SAM-dependent methyltransferase n=1 Tax=Nonomuraea soli TaxID=1032476 RepID=A0A7W0CRL2_9ACTN|nr:class I SAM-dependent methyltransferase [Nonomuraea soli]MBA2895910.1 SAM-dependent methyltransferase [Nonomuraea soli]
MTAEILLNHVAGYVGHRTVSMGLRTGLIATLAEAPATADKLAEQLGFDPFYVATWCRGAFAAGVVTREGDTYALDPLTAELLLDLDSPRYVGGLFPQMEQYEFLTRFEEVLGSGERLWWDACRPEFIAGVANTGTPFYNRLVPDGLNRIPGLAERLEAGCRILETACGAGRGLVRLARAFPACSLTGVDGDAYSISQIRDVDATLVVSPLEEMSFAEPYTLVLNNISMHECRDIDEVAKRVFAALEPGGWFVISDFPFPSTDEGLKSVPGRIMSGVQYFEAQIDDQLLPRERYDDLLARHGFVELGWFQLSPVHAVTYGRRP